MVSSGVLVYLILWKLMVKWRCDNCASVKSRDSCLWSFDFTADLVIDGLLLLG